MEPLTDLVDAGIIAADWAEALAPVEADLARIATFLSSEKAAGRDYLPRSDLILRAFERPLAQVKVLLVGQDPYPRPGHPVGLSFSVDPNLRPLPPSLVNIFGELASDTGVAVPAHGDLSAWADAGVLLLNRTLTVSPGTRNAHRGKGWEPITACAIKALATRGGPLAAILWGADARALKPLLGPVPFVESVHPSPLSAHRGFFGSRPFSRANELLKAQGGEPVDWSLDKSPSSK